MLKLIAPGKRKNKFWTVRGTLDGFKLEKSLGVCLRSDAEKKLKELIAEYETSKDVKERLTIEVAMERYLEFRNPSWPIERDMRKIVKIIKDKLVTEITPHDIISAANKLTPNACAATKNRYMTGVYTVMHYAAENKWCPWLKGKKFPEPQAVTRFVMPDVEQKLLDATDGIKHIFILWLFRQGDRVSDVLRLNYEDYDSASKTIRRYVSKSDRHLVLPVDDQLCEILDNWPVRTGRLFPWNSPQMVYKWLIPLRQSLGVEFTPHRARHTLGKKLNDSGAGLKTIMQILGQSDAKSAIRYQTTDTDTLRRAKQKATQ